MASYRLTALGFISLPNPSGASFILNAGQSRVFPEKTIPMEHLEAQGLCTITEVADPVPLIDMPPQVPTESEVAALIGASSSGALPFNYQLSSSVTEADIGKLMMQLWEGEGDLDRAAVYTEDVGTAADFFFIYDYQANPGNYIEFYIYGSTGYVSATIQEGVDFTGNANLDTQFASILAGMLANTALNALFTVTAYPTGGARAIRTVAKQTGWSWGNGNFSVDAETLQNGEPSGSFKDPLGKLLSIDGAGWGTIAPYAGQSFVAVGSVSKNAQLVGTNDGKVRARTGDNSSDRVVGLAKAAAADGEEVLLNYCPRTPEIWNGYFEERLPTSQQEALDMFAFYYWD